VQDEKEGQGGQERELNLSWPEFEIVAGQKKEGK
jgi:hypothetical protein